ncbi:energy-coupling factor ABC transporter ATP-binding protein [Thermococcus sp.]
MSRKIYEVRDVSYSYPTGKTALKNINMDIYHGEIVTIVGPNGAGKTTLLKILDGLIFPQKGEVRFMGKPITEEVLTNEREMEWFRSRVGFLFQNPDIMLFSPTVMEDVAFGPLHLYEKEKALAVTEDIMKKLDIYHLKDRHPYNLSGGEKKKASIAAVLALDPEVILLDEPTRDLDLKSRNYILSLIGELRDNGKTIIMATHDLRAIRLADRCYVLNNRIIFSGTPRELFSCEDILKEANLEIPEIIKLFKMIGIGEVPLTLEEAANLLREYIDKNKWEDFTIAKKILQHVKVKD